ncbi:potassium channel family protein [Fictibacillus barbaricus]|uniref:Trk system potassium uptake protein TrkA n=1 Tax=Fictibacillus barbaricus TaxID=182136 RepID=A0ABU1TX44_9BACL|nr:TrkA family potassium uptake protein [Fictibacillus barbaricus]MDR7071735.1 trk system potassium uptake protein TrkA [Fictibacillus barbaricus]
MSKQYAVIGLGRFGSSLAQSLTQEDNEVLGIDINEERIEENREAVRHGVIADSTDEQAMKSLGIRNFDVVIVAIGDNMQASILSVVVLKELGVKHIVAKALSKHHGLILSKVGADDVVYPERDMGQRIAQKLMSPSIIEFIKLSDEYSIEEVRISANITGKSLIELDIRARFNVNVIAVRYSNNSVKISPEPDYRLKEDDVLVVIGKNDDLKELEKFNAK